MTSTQRTRAIASLCAMFNDYHGNDLTPAWVLELHHRSTDEEIAQRLSTWRENYPEQFARFGTYVM
jgi:hypothetical protein